MKCARKSALRLVISDVLVPLLLLAIGTWYLWQGDRDLVWQKAFHSQQEGWVHADDTIWQLLYRAGTYPALLVFVAAIGVFVIGFRRPSLGRLRKVTIYLVLVMGLGPGLIANLLLKDHWPRPRPVTLEEFGGRYPFVPVLIWDSASPGKSFPAGHATMGFYFYAGYFLLRRHNRLSAMALLAGATIFGGLLGIARMAQGGHFASDSLWAAGILFLVCSGAHHLLRMEERPLLDARTLERQSAALGRIPRWAWLAASLVLVGGVTGVVVATPYQETKNLEARRWDPSDDKPLEVFLEVPFGHFTIRQAPRIRVTGQAFGHGWPGCMLRQTWEEESLDDVFRLRIRQYGSGVYTEMDQEMTAYLPLDRIRRLELVQKRGEADVHLSPVRRRQIVHLSLDDCEVRIWLPPRARVGADLRVAGSVADGTGGRVERTSSPGTEPDIRVTGEVGPRGRLVFASGVATE